MNPTPEDKKYCCSAFEQALGNGTDNEGYGSLIYGLNDDYWQIGYNVPRMKFCPWCGKEL